MAPRYMSIVISSVPMNCLKRGIRALRRSKAGSSSPSMYSRTRRRWASSASVNWESVICQALFVEERGPGFDLYDRIVAFREGGERGRGVEARLKEEVREHLARRPLTRGVGALHVGVHALELAAQVLGGHVDPAPKVLRVLAGHGFLLP